VLKAAAKVAEVQGAIVRKAGAVRRVDAKAGGESAATGATTGAAAIEGASKGRLRSISRN
jgi:hypothetical protein